MSSPQPVPVALFAYNRPGHLEQTLKALAQNQLAQDTDLYIFLDGPKKPEDEQAAKAIQKLVEDTTGFHAIKLHRSEKNKGLANSIIKGVTELLATHNSVIVLEDDMITSPYFLQYMTTSLATYEEDPEVASIHGWMYPVTEQLPETFFLKGADCWGWGTWRRSWENFIADGTQLQQRLIASGKAHAFDFDGAGGNMRMLEEQISGQNDSWAIRWHASTFLKDLLTLYPCQSLVENIGTDGSGTHGPATDRLRTEILGRPLEVKRQAFQECSEARQAIINFLRAPHQQAEAPRESWFDSLVKWGRSLKKSN